MTHTPPFTPIEVDRQGLTIMGVALPNKEILNGVAKALGANMYRGVIGVAEFWVEKGVFSASWFGAAKRHDGQAMFPFHGNTPEESSKKFRKVVDLLRGWHEDGGVVPLWGRRDRKHQQQVGCP